MKHLIIAASVLFLISGAAAGTHSDSPINLDDQDNPDAADNKPDDIGNMPDQAKNGSAFNNTINLPEQASDTAKAVTSTITESLSNGVTGLGDAISSIFQ